MGTQYPPQGGPPPMQAAAAHPYPAPAQQVSVAAATPKGQTHAPPPIVMTHTVASKPEKSDTPAWLLVGSIFCLPICCPCALAYYIIDERKYKKEMKKWNEKQEAEHQQDRANMMHALHK